MDCIETIRRDHETVLSLISAIKSLAPVEHGLRRKASHKLKEEMLPVLRAKDRTIYARLCFFVEMRELVETCRRTLHEIQARLHHFASDTMTVEEWFVTFSELETRILHHIAEEENMLLPFAQTLLTQAEQCEMALVMEWRLQEERRNPKESEAA